jgi:hypothetical protein
MHTRRVPVTMYVVTLLVVPALVVVGFMSAGLWATTGNTTLTTTRTGTSSGENSTGGAAPAPPADVKGSMTVQQVVDAFPPMTAAQGPGRVRRPAGHASLDTVEDVGGER